METYKEQLPANRKELPGFLEETLPLIQKELEEGRKEKKAHHDVTHHNIAASYLRALINEINKDLKNSIDAVNAVEKVREKKPKKKESSDLFDFKEILLQIESNINNRQYHTAIGNIHGLLRQMKEDTGFYN